MWLIESSYAPSPGALTTVGSVALARGYLPCVNISVQSDTALTASCPITGGTWAGTPLSLVVQVGPALPSQPLTLSIDGSRLPPHSVTPAGTAAAPWRWGTTIEVAAPQLAVAVPRALVLLASSSAAPGSTDCTRWGTCTPAALCLPVALPSPPQTDVITCMLRYVSEAALRSTAIALQVQYSGSSPRPAVLVGFPAAPAASSAAAAASPVFTRPQLSVTARPPQLSRTGGELIRLRLPVLDWTWPEDETSGATAAAALPGYVPNGLRGWAGNTPLRSCVMLSALDAASIFASNSGNGSIVDCLTAPFSAADALPVVRLTLELGSVLNATSDGLAPEVPLPASPISLASNTSTFANESTVSPPAVNGGEVDGVATAFAPPLDDPLYATLEPPPPPTATALGASYSLALPMWPADPASSGEGAAIASGGSSSQSGTVMLSSESFAAALRGGSIRSIRVAVQRRQLRCSNLWRSCLGEQPARQMQRYRH